MELFNELIVFMDGPIEVATILSKDEESTTCRRRSIRRPNSCIALYLTLPINPRTHPYHLHRTNSLIIPNTIIRTNCLIITTFTTHHPPSSHSPSLQPALLTQHASPTRLISTLHPMKRPYNTSVSNWYLRANDNATPYSPREMHSSYFRSADTSHTVHTFTSDFRHASFPAISNQRIMSTTSMKRPSLPSPLAIRTPGWNISQYPSSSPPGSTTPRSPRSVVTHTASLPHPASWRVVSETGGMALRPSNELSSLPPSPAGILPMTPSREKVIT